VFGLRTLKPKKNKNPKTFSKNLGYFSSPGTVAGSGSIGHISLLFSAVILIFNQFRRGDFYASVKQ